MTRLVIGTHGAVAQSLADGARFASSPARTTVREIVRRDRPTELAIVALPPSCGSLGAVETNELERLLGETLTAAAAAIQTLSELDLSTRVVIVCPTGGLIPDHRDGVRSLVSAGLVMLMEVASTLPSISVNAILVADAIAPSEVAIVANLMLGTSAESINGATIRMDGGQDAVLAAETRTEEMN
ncbi:MAG: hypothetical protein EXQ67_03895 [Thermoleophilia bacterium]|nr:hypothetical protein [Thermoleophilia bacterium]